MREQRSRSVERSDKSVKKSNFILGPITRSKSPHIGLWDPLPTSFTETTKGKRKSEENGKTASKRGKICCCDLEECAEKSKKQGKSGEKRKAKSESKGKAKKDSVTEQMEELFGESRDDDDKEETPPKKDTTKTCKDKKRAESKGTVTKEHKVFTKKRHDKEKHKTEPTMKSEHDARSKNKSHQKVKKPTAISLIKEEELILSLSPSADCSNVITLYASDSRGLIIRGDKRFDIHHATEECITFAEETVPFETTPPEIAVASCIVVQNPCCNEVEVFQPKLGFQMSVVILPDDPGDTKDSLHANRTRPNTPDGTPAINKLQFTNECLAINIAQVVVMAFIDLKYIEKMKEKYKACFGENMESEMKIYAEAYDTKMAKFTSQLASYLSMVRDVPKLSVNEVLKHMCAHAEKTFQIKPDSYGLFCVFYNLLYCIKDAMATPFLKKLQKAMELWKQTVSKGREMSRGKLKTF